MNTYYKLGVALFLLSAAILDYSFGIVGMGRDGILLEQFFIITGVLLLADVYYECKVRPDFERELKNIHEKFSSAKAEFRSFAKSLKFIYGSRNNESSIKMFSPDVNIGEFIDISRLTKYGEIQTIKLFDSSEVGANAFSAALSTADEESYLDKHHHDYAEMMFVFKGSAELKTHLKGYSEPQVYELEEGMKKTVPAYVPHEVKISANSQIIVFWVIQDESKLKEREHEVE